MPYAAVALFETTEAAAKAIEGARDAGLRDDQLSVVLRRQEIPQDNSLELASLSPDSALSTNASEGMLLGAAGGALTLALIAGPAGWLGAGWLALLAFGAGAGGLYGALGGAIIGLGFPSENLADLQVSLDAHKVLVTARLDTHEHMAQLERIFVAAGAHLLPR